MKCAGHKFVTPALHRLYRFQYKKISLNFSSLAGVGLTALTGGAFAIVAGASLICAGASLAISPVKKRIVGERLTKKELKEELMFGAAIGALATPIGIVGTVATKSIFDTIRLRIRNKKSMVNLDRSLEVKGISYKKLNDEFEVDEKDNDKSCIEDEKNETNENKIK